MVNIRTLFHIKTMSLFADSQSKLYHFWGHVFLLLFNNSFDYVEKLVHDTFENKSLS